MMKWSHTLIAGSALILLTNAVALLGAVYNRSDDPESRLQLSQRELQLDRWNEIKDNSGMTLELDWRVAAVECDSGEYSDKWRTPAWLDKSKMSELGFDVVKLASAADDRRHRKEALPREVLLVLELNGSAYMRELQCDKIRADRSRVLQAGNRNSEKQKRIMKDAAESFQSELNVNSRLFVIDAGLDIQKLRAAYPDRARYAILHGLVEPNFVSTKDKVGGHVSEIHAERINVPFNYRQVFEKAAPYEVTVAFGKRLEPWITAASRGMVAK